MKAPNGYGSCFKLSGNRRKPFCVRLTAGHNEKGQPIYKVVGYYKTRSEGMMALAEYHKQPYTFDNRNITLKEVFEKAYETQQSLAYNTKKMLMVGYRKLEKLWNTKYREINLGIMQNLINEAEPYGAKRSIKDTLRFIDTFALKNDIIIKGYAEFISMPKNERKQQRGIFTLEEVKKLWEHAEEIQAQVILLYIYTGFRKEELRQMKKESIVDNCFIGGSKTEAGKGRTVPIHHSIMPIVQKFMEREGDCLLPTEPPINKTFWLTGFQDYCEKVLGRRHIIHECRHTFVTELNRQNANPICVDRLAGHSSGHVGRDVYTHKSIEELRENIELLFR